MKWHNFEIVYEIFGKTKPPNELIIIIYTPMD